MPSFAAIQAETRPLVFTLAGLTINAIWKPGEFTPALEKKAKAANDAVIARAKELMQRVEEGEDVSDEIVEEPDSALAMMIAPCLVSWDITEDESEGSPALPITVATLERFGIGNLQVILKAMSDDASPRKPQPKRSVGSARGTAGA